MTRHYQIWTTAEEKRLLEVWASDKLIKECVDQFPGRTAKALSCRLSKLGMSKRPEGFKRNVRSNIWLLIEKMLKAGEQLTAREISNRIGCSYRHAWQLMDEKYHSNEPQIHIAHWRRARTGTAKGVWIEVWAYGEGPSPRRPKALSRAEHTKNSYVRNRVRSGNVDANPFAVAMNQVMLECAA